MGKDTFYHRDSTVKFGFKELLNKEQIGNTLIMFYKQHCKKEISLSFSKFHSRCLIWL